MDLMCKMDGNTMDVTLDGSGPWLGRGFFERDHLTVARDLIGCVLICGDAAGRIVETESYALEGDPACHTAFRRSARKFVEEKPAGALYIYLNYGVHHLVNLYARGGMDDGIILIRALKPIAGIEGMRRRRGRESIRDLCSGPGKLVQALGLDPQLHGDTILAPERTGVGIRRCADQRPSTILEDRRIGISKAVEYPWRFLEDPPEWASVRPSTPLAAG